jgi:hypothetical protein
LDIKNLPLLRIHQLSKAQYERELEANRIEENALYLMPDEDRDLDGYATEEYVDTAIQNAQLADKDIDLTNYYTKQETEALIPDISSFLKEVPTEYVTETELTDKGFLTEHQSLDGLATTQELEDHVQNSDIHVTSVDRQKWNAKSNFSGDYNDLTNAPAIAEDETGDLVIVDNTGNIIFQWYIHIIQFYIYFISNMIFFIIRSIISFNFCF